MFRGKQIKSLEVQTQKLDKVSTTQATELQKVSVKLEELEKLMESTKESLNELSASRFDSISKEIEEFNNKVETSMHSLEKLQRDMGELNLVNQSISEIQRVLDGLTVKSTNNFNSIMELKATAVGNSSSINTLSTDLQNLIVSSKTDMAQLQTDFSDSKDEIKGITEFVQQIKEELQTERQNVMEGKETIMKQEATITEKTSQLEKLELELKESRGLIGKLEAQKDGLEREVTELKDSKNSQFMEFKKLQNEFTEYKKTHEGEFSFNAAIKRLLEQSTEGKVMLELFRKSPQSIDSIAERIQVASVLLKPSINILQDINAVKVDSETRMVSL